MTKHPKDHVANDVGLSDQHVLTYLREHPDFFHRHPDLLNQLTPIKRSLGGDTIVDFQHFQLQNLQQNTKDLEHKYSGLVDFCRTHLSTQTEIHEAVLRICRADNLENLLQVIALDLPALFDLDVVRLAVESPVAREQMQDLEGMMQSGILLVESGVVDAALVYKDVRLSADSAEEDLSGVEEVFVHAESLCQSFALLRLELERIDTPVLLGLGARHTGRFHARQSVEMLQFLARVLSIHLDRYLNQLDI